VSFLIPYDILLLHKTTTFNPAPNKHPPHVHNIQDIRSFNNARIRNTRSISRYEMMLMTENQTSLAPTKPAYALNQPHPARLKYLTGFMAAVALGFGGLQGASDDNQVLRELIEILRAKGSITTEEYDALKKASATEPATSTETHAAPEVPATPPAEPTPDTEKPKRRDILADQTSSPITPLPKEAKWYDKIGFGGYTQVRYATVWNQEGEDLNVPADKSASNDQSFFLRRGRIKFSGDVHPHLYLYSQMDFAGSTASGGSFAIGMKDLYGDISLDADKAYRFRVGQSKAPFGWVNMQSSQDRAPLERPDGINSAAEGERDLGVYFMYAPQKSARTSRNSSKAASKAPAITACSRSAPTPAKVQIAPI
jgi:hypothetical protein